jgi:hypothetical protein
MSIMPIDRHNCPGKPIDRCLELDNITGEIKLGPSNEIPATPCRKIVNIIIKGKNKPKNNNENTTSTKPWENK